MNRFDICEAHQLLEWDYNQGGWLRERPSNQRRREATSIQLARMGFRPAQSLTYETLEDDGKAVYLGRVLAWKLPRDDEQNERIRAFFAPEWLREHHADVFAELYPPSRATP